jgi:hypothetical protein
MSSLKDRRLKLIGQSPPKLNGIDFVVVGAHGTAVEVHFLTAARLDATATTATITGGQPVPIHRQTWSTDASNRPLLTLAVTAPDDFSDYTLTLTNAALDPFFTSFVFSFTDGVSAVDCEAPAIVPPTQPAAAPPIDYLAKDFLSFRKALSDFSTLKYPAWQERSEADFGVMFMEALCALGDDLSYQQDRIAAEAYLATATERISIVRHARLVDYEPAPAVAARVMLLFTVSPDTVSLPAGLAVSADGPDGTAIDFETGTGLSDSTDYPVSANWNQIDPYWWDDSDQVLGAGATEMWLGAQDLGLTAGVSLLLQTTPADQPPVSEIIQVALAELQTDQLYNVAVTRIVFAQPTTVSHDLAVTVIRGNLVPATQGLRHAEAFAIANGPAGIPLAMARIGPNQSTQYLYTLGNAPLTWLADPNDPAASPTPEIHIADATAALARVWYRSLLDASPRAPAFTIDPVRYTQLPPELASGVLQRDYDGGNGDTVRFATGDFGQPPDAGTVFSVLYRAGAGALGNVAAGSITTIPAGGPLAALATAVTNPFAAQGGSDAEPNATVVRLAPYAYQSRRFNAVIPADYVAAAKTLPWVENAGCTVRYTGSWLTTFTTAEPVATALPTDDQALQLSNLLDRYHLAGSEAYALQPKYLSLDLRIAVTADANAYNRYVAAAVLQALGTGTLANGQPAFFAHSRFSFGQPLSRSALQAAVQAATGVAGVTGIQYRRYGSSGQYAEMTDHVTAGPDEIIRFDNDPSRSDAGSITLTVTGGK